jgi:hypothetical protein
VALGLLLATFWHHFWTLFAEVVVFRGQKGVIERRSQK